MIIKTKIFDENGNTIVNSTPNTNPAVFHFDFPFLPLVKDVILIHDPVASGEYIVEAIVHEVRKEKAHPIMVIKKYPLEDRIRIAIDN
jgi:hypothetical protein